MSKFGEITGKAKIATMTFETAGAAGSLKDSAAADIKCDYRIKVTLADGTVIYIPGYDTVV